MPSLSSASLSWRLSSGSSAVRPFTVEREAGTLPELIEEVSRNRLLTCQGDVVFCYRLTLPECGSLSEAHYERLFEIWRVALEGSAAGHDRSAQRPLRPPAVRCGGHARTVVYPAGGKALCREPHDDGRHFLSVRGLYGLPRDADAKSRNPFVRLTHAALREEDREYVTWTRAVDSMYQQLPGFGACRHRPADGGGSPGIRTVVFQRFPDRLSDGRDSYGRVCACCGPLYRRC